MTSAKIAYDKVVITVFCRRKGSLLLHFEVLQMSIITLIYVCETCLFNPWPFQKKKKKKKNGKVKNT